MKIKKGTTGREFHYQ